MTASDERLGAEVRGAEPPRGASELMAALPFVHGAPGDARVYPAC